MGLFKKPETTKAASGGHHKASPVPAAADTLLKVMPSWWVVLLAYLLAALFCYLIHQFFQWFPPYLKEVFKNLRGLPESWADLGLFWAERGLTWIAVLAALYHNLWQLGTRYKLTSHDIQVENWFPLRRVIAIPYGSVRRVGFQQSLVGLLFRYGHIELETGSPSGLLVLLDCPKPPQFVALLQPKVEAAVQPGLAHHRRSTDPQ